MDIEIKYDQGGWSWITSSSRLQWVKDLLPKVCCKNAAGKVYIHDPVQKSTSWHHKLITEYQDSYPHMLFVKDGAEQTADLVVHR
eukprot:1508289-Lingulodinium_polyedra.AAC.1